MDEAVSLAEALRIEATLKEEAEALSLKQKEVVRLEILASDLFYDICRKMCIRPVRPDIVIFGRPSHYQLQREIVRSVQCVYLMSRICFDCISVKRSRREKSHRTVVSTLSRFLFQERNGMHGAPLDRFYVAIAFIIRYYVFCLKNDPSTVVKPFIDMIHDVLRCEGDRLLNEGRTDFLPAHSEQRLNYKLFHDSLLDVLRDWEPVPFSDGYVALVQNTHLYFAVVERLFSRLKLYIVISSAVSDDSSIFEGVQALRDAAPHSTTD